MDEIKFIDVHAHLDMCKNHEEVIERAKEKDVIVVAAGVDHKSNATLLNLKKDYDNLKISMGIYPATAEKLNEKELDKEIEFIKEHSGELCAIGEVGLDLFEGENLEKQKHVLGKLVNLAKTLDVPLVVHSRKAEVETIDFLSQFRYKKIIMHCFSGSMKLVQRMIDYGWSLSIPANCVYSEHFQKIIGVAPIENLFCETDSPFLNPSREEKFGNEPANVIESYKKIAEIKELSLEEVKEKIWDNWKRVFG